MRRTTTRNRLRPSRTVPSRGTMTERLDIPELTWRRISPKFIVSEVLSNLAFYGVGVVVGIVFLVIGFDWAWIVVAGTGLILVVSLIVTPRRVRAYGYQLREDDLVFRKGIM